MRVLMISPQFRPLVGGYEQAAERLSGALARAGVGVVVISERRDTAWATVESISGFEVRRLYCCYRRGLHSITSLLSFACFLLHHGRQFDVWHVHQYGYHAALAIALAKVLRRPVVLKLTSSGPMGIGTALGHGTVGRVVSLLHRRVSACLASTPEVEAEAIRFGIPAERVHLIPTGVDGREFRPVAAQERVLARDALGLRCKTLVLYVGRLSSEKNPLGLLKAWGSLDRALREDAMLAIVGDGPDAGEVRARLDSSDLAGSVHLAGFCNDVTVWYRAADLYVLPSHNEGLSNSMIEAMASGLAIAATRVSGSSVLAESSPAGLVVDVADTKALARALETLLRDEPSRLRLGRNARLIFEARFSVETLSRTVILLYETLTDKRVMPRPT
jgi:glycosyltransferase involved in cell wall biosynthesis